MADIYLDESLGDLVEPLVQLGHDVVFGGEPGRSGRTDVWHFREALTTRRVIVTLDKSDFRNLHRLWTNLRVLGVVPSDHGGVLTAAQDKSFTHLGWLPAVDEKLADIQSLTGRMYRWLPSRGRWREDDARPEQD